MNNILCGAMNIILFFVCFVLFSCILTFPLLIFLLFLLIELQLLHCLCLSVIISIVIFKFTDLNNVESFLLSIDNSKLGK